MLDKVKLLQNFDEFSSNINILTNPEKEEKQDINNTLNLNVKEYSSKKSNLKQIHPLEKNAEIFYPKKKSKFSNENKNKEKLEDKKEKELFNEEEDDYSGLAGNAYFHTKYKNQKWNKNIRHSEDTYDFRNKWKTEICHFWEMNGSCKYGESCAFAHGFDELNKRKMSSNYKTKPCIQFFELGYCSYGVRCQFSHKLLKDAEDDNEDLRKGISYLKILSEFNDSSNEISHELLKRPRLLTFENITSCTLDKTEQNRRELYEDILSVKKKGSKESENKFSDATNDGNSENNKNEKDEQKNEDNKSNHNNQNKRERFISL